MKAYIAADSSFQFEARELRNKLRTRGVEITSSWIDAKLEAFHPTTEYDLERAAIKNFDDIDRAFFLIAYNPEYRHKMGTGGRHVEMGYALAKFKQVLYVGQKLENVFHRHPGVKWVSDLSGSADAHVSLLTVMERLWAERTVKPSER